eukprot:scaffold133667_cov33-Tisochrysis_lutea.AAC.1
MVARSEETPDSYRASARAASPASSALAASLRVRSGTACLLGEPLDDAPGLQLPPAPEGEEEEERRREANIAHLTQHRPTMKESSGEYSSSTETTSKYRTTPRGQEYSYFTPTSKIYSYRIELPSSRLPTDV